MTLPAHLFEVVHFIMYCQSHDQKIKPGCTLPISSKNFLQVIRRKLKILKNTPQLAALLSQELAASGKFSCSPQYKSDRL